MSLETGLSVTEHYGKNEVFEHVAVLCRCLVHFTMWSLLLPDIIPMAQEQISPVVQNGDKEDLFAMCQSKAMGTRKTIQRRKHMSDPTQLGSMP